MSQNVFSTLPIITPAITKYAWFQHDGGAAAYTQELWIEVLNRSTRLFPLAGMVLTTSKDFPHLRHK